MKCRGRDEGLFASDTSTQYFSGGEEHSVSELREQGYILVLFAEVVEVISTLFFMV